MKLLLLLLLLLPSLAISAAYPPVMKGARPEVYRKIGDTELTLWMFEEGKSEQPKPAIVFFFGGGWNGGTPAQFEKQCRYFAKRGMVAMTADYRVRSRNGTPAVECVKDGKACIAWVRANAKRLGIDPNRIAAAGGSAGGHVAASTGTLAGFGSEERPNAMILFNPGLVVGPYEGKSFGGFGSDFPVERLGAEPDKISPIHHVGKQTPPTLILHGTGDTTVPFASVEAFRDVMKKGERPCKLVAYKDMPHGFFNKEPSYSKTVAEADRFLVGLGWLK